MFSTCSDEDELREFSSRIGKEKNSDRADGAGGDAGRIRLRPRPRLGRGKRKDQLEKRYLRVGVGVRVAWGRDITTDQWAIAFEFEGQVAGAS